VNGISAYLLSTTNSSSSVEVYGAAVTVEFVIVASDGTVTSVESKTVSTTSVTPVQNTYTFAVSGKVVKSGEAWGFKVSGDSGTAYILSSAATADFGFTADADLHVWVSYDSYSGNTYVMWGDSTYDTSVDVSIGYPANISCSDTITVSDAYTVTSGRYGKCAVKPIPTDSHGLTKSYISRCSDSISISDAYSFTAGKYGKCTVKPMPTDSYGITTAYITRCSDTVSIADSYSFKTGIYGKCAVKPVPTDDYRILFPANIKTSDEITITDSYSFGVGKYSKCAVTFAPTDSYKMLFPANISVTDTISISDAYSFIIGRAGALYLDLSLTDTCTVRGAVTIIASDEISLSDQYLIYAGQYRIALWFAPTDLITGDFLANAIAVVFTPFEFQKNNMRKFGCGRLLS